MIELQMVRRMAFRGLLIAPFVIAVLAAFGGVRYGVSAAAGLAMTLLNLWLSARIIGGVAERNPELLLPAGLATFTLGLLLLTGIALGLRAADLVYFPVTGIVLVGSHLLLVLWEAAGAYEHADRGAATAETRS
ncbi:MAG TPA: hypothetical protein VHV50_05335 [Actinomycetota bacterium]|nr:hypothetical protein [Actinomycetota bacterium]